MKVLIVNPIMYTCETDDIRKVESIKDTLMYYVALGFVDSGDEVTLVTAEDFKPVCEETYPFEIQFFKSCFKKIFLPRFIPYMPGLRRYLKANKENFDFVVCSEAFSLATFTAVQIMKEKCYVWQEMFKHQKKMHKLPSRIWHNLIVRGFYRKAVIVPRSAEAREFIKNYSSHVTDDIVEHGVNADAFSPEKELSQTQFIIVSRLEKRKHIHKSIDAFSRYFKKYDSNSRLVVCGSGSLLEELKQQTHDLNMEDHISFLGQCNHQVISRELSKSTAMLVYTAKDNNMVSIIESILSGTPVITTSVPTNSTYIRGSKLGIVSDEWNEDDLHEVAANFEEYHKNCVAYIDEISSKATAKKFHKIYDRCRTDRQKSSPAE